MSGSDRLVELSGNNGARRSGWTALRQIFYLGIGIKRWLLLVTIGVAICSIGLAIVLKNLLALNLPDLLMWYLEGVLLAIAGIVVIVVGFYGLYRSVGPLLFTSPSFNTLTDTIYTRRSRRRGPKIVAVGGGTGLSVLLRGLKSYTDNLTAIVTVADDGGSSGRLRRDLGVLPPGDFRNCLVAMSDDESLVRELFQYRFDHGDGLEGHSFGNLFIAAMTEVTGSFEQALYESSRVLAVHGQILPATLANLSLSARLADGSTVEGESAITELGGVIDEILIEPADSAAYPPAVKAIEQAQLIVIGPGSLYTSILPNLLVSGIANALSESNATKVYVCNVVTQKGETVGYTVADHVKALQRHTFQDIVDYVVANDTPEEFWSAFSGQPVAVDDWQLGRIRLVTDDLVDLSHPVRHDSAKLAQMIIDVYHGKRRVGERSSVAVEE